MPAITERDLERIRKSLEGYLERLRTLARDIERRTEIIYNIDFADVFVYMRLEEKISQTGVIESILEASGQKYVLLPGSVWEFLYRLRRGTSILGNIVRQWGFRDLKKIEELKRFIDAFKKKKSSEEILNAYNDLIKKYDFVTLLQKEHYLSQPLKRLKKLVENKVLISAEEANINLNEAGIDEEIFNDVLKVLNEKRPGLTISNRIDAYNFAQTNALNDKFYNSNKRYFNIITHAPILLSIYKTISWMGDPLRERYPDEILTIAREPIDKWCAINIEEQFKGNVENMKRYAEEGVELCKDISKSLPAIPKYVQTLRKLEEQRKKVEALKDPERLEQLREDGRKTVEFSLRDMKRLRQFNIHYRDPLDYIDKGREDASHQIKRRMEELYKKIETESNVLEELEEAYKNLLAEIRYLYELLNDFINRFAFRPVIGENMLEELDEVKRWLESKAVLEGEDIIKKGPVDPKERIIEEQKAYLKKRSNLYKRYLGKVVAILDGEVIDSDEDEDELAKRIYSRVGYIPVYIHKVDKEKDRAIVAFGGV